LKEMLALDICNFQVLVGGVHILVADATPNVVMLADLVWFVYLGKLST
jgi:hypothetical protein